MMKQMFFLLALPALLVAEIIETNTIYSILDYVQEDTLVLVDLDNTIIEPEQYLGSSQWGDYLATSHRKSGLSVEEVDLIVGKLWFDVQPQIKIRCVDQHAPNVINQLNGRAVPLMGFTGRHPNEVHFTLDQLASVEIQFNNNVMNTDFHEFHADKFRGVVYQDGILFCTPINKKSFALKLLIEFLEKTDRCPKRIVFIDDKLSHVKDVVLQAESLGIECIGLRFNGADKRISSFCPKIAKIQLDHLPHIVSDEEAVLILELQQEAA